MNYLRIACLVPDDGNLWSLLRALVDHKARDVEVLPALPATTAAPAAVTLIARTPQKKKYVRVNRRVDPKHLLTHIDGETTIAALTGKSGWSRKTVSNALNSLRKNGLVKRIGYGLYARSAAA